MIYPLFMYYPSLNMSVWTATQIIFKKFPYPLSASSSFSTHLYVWSFSFESSSLLSFHYLPLKVLALIHAAKSSFYRDYTAILLLCYSSY